MFGAKTLTNTIWWSKSLWSHSNSSSFTDLLPFWLISSFAWLTSTFTWRIASVIWTSWHPFWRQQDLQLCSLAQVSKLCTTKWSMIKEDKKMRNQRRPSCGFWVYGFTHRPFHSSLLLTSCTTLTSGSLALSISMRLSLVMTLQGRTNGIANTIGWNNWWMLYHPTCKRWLSTSKK